ncbi:hypothetical protein JEZ13_00675 [bacterium]|nr:hypothetical protein [bacterium]
MKLIFRKLIPVLAIIICSVTFLNAASVDPTPTKQFDLTKYHDVGNIWLRVSNYGFFGSGSDITPQYPSLEYPGGSGIDYLYQGALWFGAKKIRRNATGEKLYWVNNNPYVQGMDVIAESELPADYSGLGVVLDTLVSVGFDGDMGLNEFLPAYNPLENANPNVADFFGSFNSTDKILTASTRSQKRGVDDDGDGLIDEDGPGFTFPMRDAHELPEAFQGLGSIYLHEQDFDDFTAIETRSDIWFPLGFMDLSASDENGYFNFATPYDDDGDGRVDEDSAPVSEQDFISYYYDYSPFDYEGQRDWGRDRARSEHYPLNVRVRQMSYQWSYEYIKNLVYIEFNITNMNAVDTLFDCAMGVYMDSDVGPQSWDSDKASDDLSGYQKGDDYEFAYTRDDDGDGGLTTGLVGSRVCSPIPNPDSLNYSCWFWEVGDGPDDTNIRRETAPSPTHNEKFWLLIGKNPDADKFEALRKPDGEGYPDHFIQPLAADTRYLFAFSGFQPGSPEYNEVDAEGNFYKRWNLAPRKTMKIVIAVFPGENLEDLKATSIWAKTIYGTAQSLTNVVLPDTVLHYTPPEPPEIPNLFAEISEDGNYINYYWDNRSVYSYDKDNVSGTVVGWQDVNSNFDSWYGNWDEWSEIYADVLDVYPPTEDIISDQETRTVSPVTAYRLRHDFQGFRTWIRSGSGSQEDWSLVDMWGKIETPTDIQDYDVNYGVTNSENGDIFADYGGYTAIDTGLPSERPATEDDTNYYKYDENYTFRPIELGEIIYGHQIYKHDVDYTADLQAQANQIALDDFGLIVQDGVILTDDVKAEIASQLFRRDDVREDIFKELYDEKLIPLYSFGAQFAIGDPERLAKIRIERLARRYFTSSASVPRKGVETYVAVTAFDRGMPSKALDFLETGRDADANMKVFFPAPNRLDNDGSNVYVVPNPYVGGSSFDGRRENDDKGDKSKRIWFVNLPARSHVKIFTLAGDLVDEFRHEGAYEEDIITVSKAARLGITSESIHSWDLLSKNNQIVAPGVYLFSVKNLKNGDINVGKFVLIK